MIMLSRIVRRGPSAPSSLLAKRLSTSLREPIFSSTSIGNASMTRTHPPVIEEIPTAEILRAENSMPRSLTLSSPAGVLRGLDYFGTGIFAISGSITAATAGMDSLGCVIVGTVTAVGGGTIRDALIMSRMPFWTVETEYLTISALAALGAFFAWPLVEPSEGGLLKRPGGKEGLLLQMGDSLGVGAFATIGAMNGVRLGCLPVVSVICGMVTATFGGLARDVLAGRPGRILHSFEEIYATTALGGASAYVLLSRLRAPSAVRILGGVGAALALRTFASLHEVKLPFWDERTRLALARSNVISGIAAARDEQVRFAERMFGGVTPGGHVGSSSSSSSSSSSGSSSSGSGSGSGSSSRVTKGASSSIMDLLGITAAKEEQLRYMQRMHGLDSGSRKGAAAAAAAKGGRFKESSKKAPSPPVTVEQIRTEIRQQPQGRGLD